MANDGVATPDIGVWLGYSVAISADGNTIAVGGVYDNNFTGAAWVFVRCGCTWSQQGTKLISSTAAPNDGAGYSVALSADGNILAVGAFSANLDSGEVIVYTRNDMGIWSQQTIIPGDTLTGLSVSLSSVGDVLVAGGILDVLVFRNMSGVWTLQTIIPLVYPIFSYSQFVSLSADGSTLAIGDSAGPTGGQVYIYVYSGNTWIQQGIPLIGNNFSGPLGLGAAVSLSGDGNTLAAGGPFNNMGLTVIFTRESGLWQQREILIGTSYLPQYSQGVSLSLSSEGSVLAVTNGTGGGITNPLLWIFT